MVTASLFSARTTQSTATFSKFGVDGVNIVPVALPEGMVFTKQAMRNDYLHFFREGGPLAFKSAPLYSAIIEYYTKNQRKPCCITTDFFTTAANDAGDFLNIPVVTVFPNPIGMTSLPKPGKDRASVSWYLHEMTCRLAEAVGARLMVTMRNCERALRGLPSLVEQDIWPSEYMTRMTIATTGYGFEYACVQQSPLLHLVGPSAPTSYPELPRNLEASLGDWMDSQQVIIYVAFGTMFSFTEASCQHMYSQLNDLLPTNSSNQCSESAQQISVLWSLPASQQMLLHENGADVNDRIRIESFVPQYAVLAHSGVKVFVSDGSHTVVPTPPTKAC